MQKVLHACMFTVGETWLGVLAGDKTQTNAA